LHLVKPVLFYSDAGKVWCEELRKYNPIQTLRKTNTSRGTFPLFQRLIHMSKSRAGFSRMIFLFTLLCLVLVACATRTNPQQPPGILEGTVEVGPLSPVEQVGAPPVEIPPEVYTSRAVDIYQADGQTFISRVFFDADGTYQTELPPGNYFVSLTPNGIDTADGLPVMVEIHSGKVTTLNLSIDTGIR
jgi:hypothetical protein